MENDQSLLFKTFKNTVDFILSHSLNQTIYKNNNKMQNPLSFAHTVTHSTHANTHHTYGKMHFTFENNYYRLIEDSKCGCKHSV